MRSALRLLMGAMVAARFEPFRGAGPRSVPTTQLLRPVADLVVEEKVRPVIDRTFRLEESADAIRYVETEHARAKAGIALG